MTNNIKLEVGQWVELNNGKRYEVEKKTDTGRFLICGGYYTSYGVYWGSSKSYRFSVARILPHIKLPSGDVLFEGDFAKRRDGEVVGPLRYDRGPEEVAPWFDDIIMWYHSTGKPGFSSRQDLDLIARADPPEAETQDEPKLLRDMTAEEVVALVEADKAGETIQCFSAVNWYDCREFVMDLDCAYRIKPAEPVRETVAMTGGCYNPNRRFWCFGGNRQAPYDTHRITFDLVDGKPDPASIKMEELE